MADRFVLKQFAGSATNNGAFGAAQATGAGVQPVENIKDVQSLNAFEQGWNSATLTADKLPALEEMQGLEALLCKAIKENYSEGIPLWISGETYYQYSFSTYNGKIYYNKTGNTTANNPASDTTNWGEYKPSSAGTADKLGSSNVGSSTQPMYLSSGTATASTATVGTATKPVYLSGGKITQGYELAKINLSNINASGEQVIKNLITSSAANVDLSNLSATGNAKFQDPITGGATTITSSDLTASRALTSNASGKVAVSSVTSTELGYVSGVTSSIQTQLNAKQDTITGAATSITSSDLTASKALVSDANGKVGASTTTSTELGYLSGVTSAIQTQLDNRVTLDTAQTISAIKTFSAVPVMTGTLNAKDNSTNMPTTAWVRNHCCTTKATTTSTASKDAPAYVVENYKNGLSWYRVWSDGWIEQGGFKESSAGSIQQFNLNKAFTAADYTVLLTPTRNDIYYSPVTFVQTQSTTTTSFKAFCPSTSAGQYWYACGY